MYAFAHGKAWLRGNAAWDITCDILLIHLTASDSKTPSVHTSGNTTQAGSRHPCRCLQGRETTLWTSGRRISWPVFSIPNGYSLLTLQTRAAAA